MLYLCYKFYLFFIIIKNFMIKIFKNKKQRKNYLF